MISPELMGHVKIAYVWKVFVFHRGCSYDTKSFLDKGLIAGRRDKKGGRQTIFLHTSQSFLGIILMRKHPAGPSQHSEKYIIAAFGSIIKTQYIG